MKKACAVVGCQTFLRDDFHNPLLFGKYRVERATASTTVGLGPSYDVPGPSRSCKKLKKSFFLFFRLFDLVLPSEHWTSTLLDADFLVPQGNPLRERSEKSKKTTGEQKEDKRKERRKRFLLIFPFFLFLFFGAKVR